MSQATNVPIEPSEQTQLLDQCMEVPGTIMAGVPGGNNKNNNIVCVCVRVFVHFFCLIFFFSKKKLNDPFLFSFSFKSMMK